MIAAATLLLLLGQSTSIPGGYLTETIKGANGKHRFQIFLRCENFKARGRKVQWANQQDLLVAGRKVFGHDGWGAGEQPKALDFMQKHFSEVRAFTVAIDGKSRRVPASLYCDLMNLNLDGPKAPSSTEYRYGEAWLSSDGKKLVLKQSAADGAGAYTAYFIFQSNGLVERRIYYETGVEETRRGSMLG